jgi:acetylornithine deacetylase/succinyl-diaminopimelate desuccinylase-like protein
MLSITSPIHYGQQTAQRSRWLSQLAELIAFPTISALPQHRKDIKACAQWLARHLAEIGLQHVQILPGAKGGHPSVYADWLHAPGKPTLLLYGHYDVQPVDPLREWRTPPFTATIVGDNLYARGASDDKGQLFIHLKAVESYLRTSKALPINIKIWLEGEEEIGSPHLTQFLKQHSKRLQADAVLVSDTEMLGKGRPSIIYGLRGNLNCELEVSGAKHDLHSGRYGGAVLNPLQALSDAKFSFRLVPDRDPIEIARLLQQQIAATSHPAVRTKLQITGSSRPVILPKRSPVTLAAIRAVEKTWGKPPAFTRSGGSIPLVEQLHRRLGIPIVLLGFGLPDDDIHAPNEKMSLSNLFQGIATVIQFLAEYAR